MIRKGDGRGSGYGAKGRVVLERESAYIVEGRQDRKAAKALHQ